jgi:methionyl-tRNA formyltransferase
MMRVVFMGTPGFAVPSLEALAPRHDVVAVLTQPDRPRGRGREPAPGEVKLAAGRLGLSVEQPVSLAGEEVAERLRSYAPDVVVVAAYGKLLPPAVLDVPPLGCVNVHASLLPRHRGAAPIQRAILEGDESTGVSIMSMTESLDDGPVAAESAVTMGDLYAGELTTVLADAGALLLLEVLDQLLAGSVVWAPQDGSAATYAARMTAADVALDPSLDVVQAHRRVRASTSSAPCRLRVAGRLLRVVKAHAVEESPEAPGSVLTAVGLDIGLADGTLRLDTIVPEGKREMSGAEWARGARLGPDAGWSAP